MNMVGPDKRTQYYRLSPEAVLKTLKSHSLGLTNSDAARRQTEHGANILPVSPVSAAALALQAAGHPFVAVTALGAALASWADQTGAALVLAVLTLLHMTLRYRSLHSRVSIKENIVLPIHTKVTRNDQTRSLETALLVVGDIVYVEAGDTVPADLRVLEEHDLVTNDSTLFGGNLHTRKFAHAIQQAVPLIARNNQLWTGSTIVQGTARGVVIATGAQTELGRITVLHQTAGMNKLTRQSRSPRSYAFAVSALLVVTLLLFIGWQSGGEYSVILPALLLLVISMVPNGLDVSRWLISTLASQQLSIRSDTLAALGGVDMALFDTTESSKNIVVASSVTVGRATYTIEDTGYEPAGRILDRNNKALTHKQLAELKLLFEACTYTNSAAVLHPDSHHKAWHARGNLYEVAALVLARKAGLNTEHLQTKHETLRSFPYDAGRQLASSMRRYGGDNVVFVRGNTSAVLGRCKKIWDHGHVRSLSAGDKTFLTRETPAAKGTASMAFAYRILPDTVDPGMLAMDAAEQDLTLLGIVAMQHVSKIEGVIAAARATGLTTITLTAETQPDAISSAALRKLTDGELTKLLRDNTTFSRLVVEDMLRLVTVAQHAGHSTAVFGNSLASLPAQTEADAGFSLSDSYSILAHNIQDTAGLVTALSLGRNLLAKLANARHLAIIQSVSLTIAAFFGSIGLFYYHIPLTISLSSVLIVELLVFPLAAYALPPLKVRQVVTREFTAAGTLLGALAYSGFLYSFSLQGISPNFIGSDSSFALTAMAAATAIVSLGLLIEVILMHYQTKTRLGTQAVVYLSVAVLLIINATCNPLLQPLFGIGSLTFSDWLNVSAALLLYTVFRLFQHHTRHHTREAVLQLHQELHSKHS